MKQQLKRVHLILFVCCFCISAQAQKFIQLLSIDEPIAYAFVSLSDADSTIIRKGFSDPKGRFLIAPEFSKMDSILVQVSHTTYEPYQAWHDPSGNSIVRPTFKRVLIEMVDISTEYEAINSRLAVNRLTVIGRERIESSGASDLGNLLDHQSDIRVNRSAVIGTGISMKGLNSNGVKILIDGAPMIGRVNGQLDLGRLDLSIIERIEIVNGPMAVDFGTDALAGVINIITKDNADKKSIKATLRTESIGQYDSHLHIDLPLKKVGLSLSAGRRFFDGWSDGDRLFDNGQPIADSRRVKQWKQKEQIPLRLRLGNKGEKSTWKWTSSFLNEKLLDRGEPLVSTLAAIAFDDRWNTSTSDNTLHFNSQLSDSLRFESMTSFSMYDRGRERALTDLTTLATDQLTGFEDDVAFSAIRSRAVLKVTKKKSRLSLGYDLAREEGSGDRILGSPSIRDLALFSKWKKYWRSGIVVEPAIRMSHNDVYGVNLSPSLNVKWSKSTEEYRLSYGRGFRSPSFKELYLDFVDINHDVRGNVQLQPERSHSLDLSAEHRWGIGRLFQELSFSSYYNDVDDGIELLRIGQASEVGAAVPFTYGNVGSLQTYGFRLGHRLKTKEVNLNYNLVWAGKDYKSVRGEEGLRPQINLNLTYTYKDFLPLLSSSFSYQGVNAIAIIQEDESPEVVEQEAFALWDVNVAQSFFDTALSVNFGIRNILNVKQVQLSNDGGFHNGTGGSALMGSGTTLVLKLAYHWQQ